MAEVFGIDFGTTNSLVTYIGADGRPHSSLDAQRRPHPSGWARNWRRSRMGRWRRAASRT